MFCQPFGLAIGWLGWWADTWGGVWNQCTMPATNQELIYETNSHKQPQASPPLSQRGPMVQAEYNAELARALLRRSPLTQEERQGWDMEAMQNAQLLAY